MVDRVSRVACLSLWELCYGNLEGGLPCWGPSRNVEKRLWRRASSSIRAPFGEPGEGLIYGGIFEMVKGALRMRRLSP